MKQEGFIMIYRSLLGWRWFHDSNMVHFYMYLLLKANYEPSFYKDQEIKRGQLVFGRLQAEKDTGIPEHTIRYCLKRLKLTGEITVQLANNFSVITICKYESYQTKKEKVSQPFVPPVSQPLANLSPTFSQPLATYKEDNTIINKEINNTRTGERELFSFEDFWKSYDKNINELECRKWWNNHISEPEKECICLNLPAYVAATPDKKFRKDPLHYLIKKGWTDEIIKPAPEKKEKSAIDLYIENEL